MSLAERLTGLDWRANGPLAMVGLGHGATHWIAATFYILLPSIAEAFSLSYAEAGALVGTMHAASFAANLASGPLVDMTGRSLLLMLVSLLVGGLALALLGVGEGHLWLALMVVLIGATNNLWHPPAIAFLSARYPANRGYALSIHALGANLGDAAAPLAAGALLTLLTWQMTAGVALLPVLVVALALALALGRLERRGAGRHRPAGPGLAAWAAGVGRVARDRAVLGLALMTGFRAMTQNGLLMFLPLYLANVLGAGPVAMGLALSAMQLGGVVATPLAGIWSDRIGRRPVALMGLTGSTVMIAGLTLLNQETTFIVGVSVLGFVLYAMRPVVHSWMMDLAPRSVGGSTASLMSATQTGFSILMPPLAGLIADQHGLAAVFYALAATMLAGNVIAWMLPGARAGDAKPAGG